MLLSKEGFLRKYHSSKVYLSEWILAAIIFLVVLFSFVFVDTRSLTIWSTNLWDVIWEGRPFDFYLYTSQNIHGAPHELMGSDIISILPLSIWNIPIWIAQRFFGKEISGNYILLSWSKLGLILCLATMSYVAYRIAKKLTDNKDCSVWTAILTFSNASCVAGVGFAGQNDIFFVFLSLLSVNALINKKTAWFIIYAALSISIKPFFLFAYIPLVLFTDKNIFRIFAKIVGAASLYVGNRIIFSAMPMYKESLDSGPTTSVIKHLFSPGIDVSKGSASLYIIGFLIICFIAYVVKAKDDEERSKFLIYIPTAVYFIQCCLSYTEYYRSLVIMPFAAILFAMNFKKFRLNLALLATYQFSFLAMLTVNSKYFLAPRFIKHSLFETLFNGGVSPELAYSNLPSYMLKYEDSAMTYLKLAFAAVYVVTAILILVLNYPRFNKKIDLIESGVFAKYDHGLLILNILIIVPFILLSFKLYFA